MTTDRWWFEGMLLVTLLATGLNGALWWRSMQHLETMCRMTRIVQVEMPRLLPVHLKRVRRVQEAAAAQSVAFGLCWLCVFIELHLWWSS